MPTETLQHEPGFRDPIRAVVGDVEAAVGRFFPAGALRMGGGIVLVARWGHRRSSDISLFCPQATYFAVSRRNGQELEQSLQEVSSNPGGVMVDLLQTRAVIRETEVTLLPEEPLIGERTHRVIPGTAIETWSSADILAGKLLYRWPRSQIVEPRDLYDIAAAEHHEPAALRKVAQALGPLHHERIRTLLKMLSEGWAEHITKPLVGLPEKPVAHDPDTIVALLDRFACEPVGATTRPEKASAANLAGPVARLLGRHCAGLKRPAPAAMRRYLLAPPPKHGTKEAIDWCAYSLLGKSTMWDLLDLIGASQIPVGQIAAHVRALGVTSQPVTHFLHQFKNSS